MPEAVAESSPLPKGVILFSLAYLLPAIAVAVSSGNGEFVFYSVVMVLLMAAVIAVHRNVNLSPAVLWGLSLWGAVHMAGGLVPLPESWPANGPHRVLYSWWLIPTYLKFDQVVHAYGFGVTTFVCWQGLRACVRTYCPEIRLAPTAGALLLSAAASMGFGALNEVVEFAATLLLPSTNVGGYVNTGWDLVSNLVGCLVAAVIIRCQTPVHKIASVT